MKSGAGDAAYTEVVGLFHASDDLEEAISRLTSSGWDHAELSLLAQHKILVSEEVETPSEELARQPETERQPAVSDSDVRQARTLVAGTVGVAAAFLASGATIMTGGGTLAAIVGAAALGGGAGGFVEVLGQRVRSQRDRFLHEQMEQGGILLWVRVEGTAKDRKARDILASCGATDIHLHGSAETQEADGRTSE